MALVKLSGMWKRKTKNGDEVIGGAKIAEALPVGAELVIFPNGFKREDRDPDYVLYLSTGEGRESSSSGSSSGASVEARIEAYANRLVEIKGISKDEALQIAREKAKSF